MANILIIASTNQELAYLARELGAERVDQRFSVAWRARTSSRRHDITLLSTGIGKVNSAWKLSMHLSSEGSKTGLIIDTGICGAYSSACLDVGDIAVAISEVFGDEGVISNDGWQSMTALSLPLMIHRTIRYFNEFPLSLERCERAVHLASTLGLSLRRGKFVTVSSCSGTSTRGDELAGRFSAICENMEGAAIAQLATAYDIPCMEIRGVSNLVEDRDISRWNIPLAAEAAQRFILRYIEQVDEI